MKVTLSQITPCYVFLQLASTIRAHSWVEQLLVISSEGTFIGTPGYSRGNVLRAAPGFSDNQMVNLIPPNGRAAGNIIFGTDLMCSSTQTKGNQTPNSPALIASPGDMIALRYQENGHVTEPFNQPGKPENRGTVYIYGTSEASDSDTLLNIHNVWNSEGTGGDQRGRLLSTQNFDDGQCYQINNSKISKARQGDFPHTADPLTGADLWCQVNITIPTSIAARGVYTLYWVWDWPTAIGTPGQPNGLLEIYTTCIDINLVEGAGTSESVNFSEGQDLNSAAISSELLTAYVSIPTL
ncbi:hypothetical protein V496_00065 [Pseudogymnoascus sp. VKM F-4515 (FW-2607)]|nr:hypothetical protein V496_00065 [Pseudogymnoascus sp. VKM F-4515 (FW-2607)]